MRSFLNAEPGPRRRPASFALSLGLHGLAAAWVAFAPPFPAGRPDSLYNREILPHRNRLIFYQLSDRLPDIRPAAPRAATPPPRAHKRFEQTIVAGARDDSRPPQLIYTPAPEIPTPKLLPLPNLVSLAAAPARRFIPPVPRPAPPVAAPKLPEAPQIAAVHQTGDLMIAAKPVRPAALPFHAPAQRRENPPSQLTLPPALEIPADQAPALAGALAVAASPPPAPRPPAPDLAIAGLAPVAATDIPAPAVSRPAAFSAGPTLRPEGGSGTSSGTALQAPGLLVEGGGKDAKPALVAHAPAASPENPGRTVRSNGGIPVVPPPGRQAMHVSDAPDPRLEGRVVYTMAIQMPNISSYSGSWMVWFAEHEPDPGRPPQDVQPPLAMRQVDPKYIRSAADERVEGKVRLWAVIGKDGHIGSVALLSHLDDRLDQSAEEALSKWIFQPARFNGIPVEVDAVFEVPFHLAPRPAR